MHTINIPFPYFKALSYTMGKHDLGFNNCGIHFDTVSKYAVSTDLYMTCATLLDLPNVRPFTLPRRIVERVLKSCKPTKKQMYTDKVWVTIQYEERNHRDLQGNHVYYGLGKVICMGMEFEFTAKCDGFIDWLSIVNEATPTAIEHSTISQVPVLLPTHVRNAELITNLVTPHGYNMIQRDGSRMIRCIVGGHSPSELIILLGTQAVDSKYDTVAKFIDKSGSLMTNYFIARD